MNPFSIRKGALKAPDISDRLPMLSLPSAYPLGPVPGCHDCRGAALVSPVWMGSGGVVWWVGGTGLFVNQHDRIGVLLMLSWSAMACSAMIGHPASRWLRCWKRQSDAQTGEAGRNDFDLNLLMASCHELMVSIKCSQIDWS